MRIGDLGSDLKKRLREAGHLRRGVLQMSGDRKSVPELKAVLKVMESDSKYKNRRVCLDGHVFQSQLEADYYSYLKAIHVRALEVHPSVSLVGGIRYKPDFSFVESGRKIFIDTKSDATKGGRYPTIKNLWREFGPGVLREVYRGPRGTFIVKLEVHSKGRKP